MNIPWQHLPRRFRRGGPEQCGHCRGSTQASGQTQLTGQQLGTRAAVSQPCGATLGVLAKGHGDDLGMVDGEED